MNRVVTTDASITAGQPIVANAGLGTLPFMEDGYQEAMANIVKGILGTYTTDDLIVLIDPLIIITGGGNTATWTDGAIFYNDEIYTIAAGTLTKAGGDTFLYSISDIASPVLDPVYFKDNVARSPHRVRQITITSGISGAGIADYGASTIKPLKGLWSDITAINSWSNPLAVGSGKARYKKGITDEIVLQGVINANGATPTNPIIFTLPTGYRPSNIKQYIAYGSDGTTAGSYLIRIQTNGDVQFLNTDTTTPTYGTTAFILLDTVRFYTDN